jgi:hypothetical protein
MSKDYFEQQREDELAALKQSEKHYIFWEHNYCPVTMHRDFEMTIEQRESRVAFLNRTKNI